MYLLISSPLALARPDHRRRWPRLDWAIKNRAHDVPDPVVRESGCGLRYGSLPRGMAAFAVPATSVLWLPGKRILKRSTSIFKLRPRGGRQPWRTRGLESAGPAEQPPGRIRHAIAAPRSHS